MKKILVISHERSGTHFLIDSIALSFNLSNQWTDVYCKDIINPDKNYIKNYRDEIHQFFYQNFHLKTDKFYKSHHQSYYFEPMFDQILQHYHIFYIVRDPKDTICSCFTYFKNTQIDAFPQCYNIDKLLSIQPYDFPFDGAYSYVKSANMIDRWYNHVQSWIKHKNQINIITYHQLKSDFNNTIIKISNILNQKVENINCPKLGGVNPNKGIEKNYLTMLNENQIKLIDNKCLQIYKDIVKECI